MPWAAHKLKCSASHRPHPNYPQAMGKWGQSMDSLKKNKKTHHLSRHQLFILKHPWLQHSPKTSALLINRSYCTHGLPNGHQSLPPPPLWKWGKLA